MLALWLTVVKEERPACAVRLFFHVKSAATQHVLRIHNHESPSQFRISAVAQFMAVPSSQVVRETTPHSAARLLSVVRAGRCPGGSCDDIIIILERPRAVGQHCARKEMALAAVQRWGFRQIATASVHVVHGSVFSSRKRQRGWRPCASHTVSRCARCF